MFYSQKRFTCTLYSAIKIKLLFLVCNVMNLSYILKQIQSFLNLEIEIIIVYFN